MKFQILVIFIAACSPTKSTQTLSAVTDDKSIVANATLTKKSQEIDKKITDAAIATQGKLGDFEKQNVSIEDGLKKLQTDLQTEDATQTKNIADSIEKLSTVLNATSDGQKAALLKQITDLEAKLTTAQAGEKNELVTQINTLKDSLKAAGEYSTALQSKLDLLTVTFTKLQEAQTKAQSDLISTSTVNSTQSTDIAALTKRLDEMQQALKTLIAESLPVGSVAFLNKDLQGDELPQGWELCPDKFQGAFIVGEDPSNKYLLNTTGGFTSVRLSIANMPSHTHSTQYDGNHTHNYEDSFYPATGNCGTTIPTNFGYDTSGATYTGRLGTCYNTRLTNDDSQSKHNHTLTYVGGSSSFEIIPPYIALRVICRKSTVQKYK